VTTSIATKPLAGWRVLVPRGGAWGEAVASGLREKGAVPVVAPLVNFAPAIDQETLDKALADLSAGAFDWFTVTSTATVDVLFAHGVQIPEGTKIAAVGETTAVALADAGYRADLVSDVDNSAVALAEKLIAAEPEPRRILAMSSETARRMLPDMLAHAGHDVRAVAAYRTVGSPVAERARRDVESGRINAIIVTGPAVALQVREQFAQIPPETLVIGIGALRAIGNTTGHPPAERMALTELMDAVGSLALPHAVDEFPL
jgi:uroporphyrinogen-III synthase